MMHEEEFSHRLVLLRSKRGVSASNMSLSIGQNPGYINTIENGKALPTMTNFFYICDFLHISPKEFFYTNSEDPKKCRSDFSIAPVISELIRCDCHNEDFGVLFDLHKFSGAIKSRVSAY